MSQDSLNCEYVLMYVLAHGIKEATKILQSANWKMRRASMTESKLNSLRASREGAMV